MACRECRAFQDPKDPREGKVQKDKLVIMDCKECQVLEEDRGREGPPGKSGPRGIQGMKGEQGLLGMKGEQGAVGIKGARGIMGNQGKKGDKGEKGESVKASQASVVPQTNWKQCVWKSESSTDNGKIKVIRIRIITHS